VVFSGYSERSPRNATTEELLEAVFSPQLKLRVVESQLTSQSRAAVAEERGEFGKIEEEGYPPL
jgi:hypothetical protein